MFSEINGYIACSLSHSLLEHERFVRLLITKVCIDLALSSLFVLSDKNCMLFSFMELQA